MIDEKKIEEAAKEYAEQQEKICKELAEKHTSTSSICSIVSKNPDAAFKDGINWFLDNLFHPSDEESKVGKEYLLKATFFNDEGYSFDAYVTSTFSVDGWREDFFPRGFDIEVKEWACIDDLQKGGK